MGSYRQIFYQIVFGTKRRIHVINKVHKDDLYKYISAIIHNKKCHLYRINGIGDHIHIFTDLHPSVALADLVKDIKVASALWIKQTGYFPEFEGWAEGYGAFTYSFKEKDRIIEYIKDQERHHQKQTYRDEYKMILIEFGIEFQEEYLP